jgi:hypothetical protein
LPFGNLISGKRRRGRGLVGLAGTTNSPWLKGWSDGSDVGVHELPSASQNARTRQLTAPVHYP